MKNAAFGELIGLRGHAILHKPVGVEIDPTAGVFRQRRLQRQNTAKAVGALLQIGVTKNKIILHEAAECLLAQEWMRDKGAGQNIAFNGNRRAVVHGGTVGARQPIKADRWFIPTVHLHTFHVIQ